MPLEIKELVIRAVVEAEPAKEGGPLPGGEASSDRAALVEQCVREVLKILQRTQER